MEKTKILIIAIEIIKLNFTTEDIDMKKITSLLLVVLTAFTLSSCFLFGGVTTHPDMVEYTEEEVLSVAEDKYSITEWIITGTELVGKASYDAEGAFCLEFYDDGQFSTDFVGGDNIEAAMQAFAGKNGNHDIQGRYSNFLCLIALGKCADGSIKYVYYNTNIRKDAEIADTIGASDYTFDVLPTEITDSLFDVPSNWHQMRNFFDDFKGANPLGFYYSGERLSRRRMESYYDFIVEEFYKEDGKVVCDMYYLQDEGTPEERKILFYSTSLRYEVIYNCYGDDVTDYFDISQTVEQSTEAESMMLLQGHAELKELPGTVVYTQIKYRAEYSILHDGNITSMIKNDQINNQTTINQGYLIEKIDGVDHAKTAKFSVYDYYILCEKNTVNISNN